MTHNAFLERDADLLALLTPEQRRSVEFNLTSHAIEDMEPTREHTSALVDLTRGAITFEEYIDRLGMREDFDRAQVAKAAGE